MGRILILQQRVSAESTLSNAAQYMLHITVNRLISFTRSSD